jgi:hypothetical protein
MRFIGLTPLFVDRATEIGEGLLLQPVLQLEDVTISEAGPVDEHHVGPRLDACFYVTPVEAGLLFRRQDPAPLIATELVVSQELAAQQEDFPLSAATDLVRLLRIRGYSSVHASACASRSFTESNRGRGGEVYVAHVEELPYQLGDEDYEIFLAEGSEEHQWIANHLPVFSRLRRGNLRFKLAVTAFDAAATSYDVRYAVAILWTGIDALFSQRTAESSFKMECAWAAYLAPHGSDRNALRKELEALFDVRSRAVHGHALIESKAEQGYYRTRSLFKQSLIKMIEQERVPDVGELMNNVFE